MKLNYEQFEQLFNIVREEPHDAVLSIQASDLLKEDQAIDFLKAFQAEIKGQDLQVASTYFASAWRGVCVVFQYMISLSETRLDLSLTNLSLHISRKKGYPALFFLLQDAAEHPWPAQERDRLRADALEGFYRDTLRPVFGMLANVSGLPAAQVWGQLPLGVAYYIRHISGELEHEADRLRLQEDHEYLIKGVDSSVFGLSRNPFNYKPKWIEDLYNPGQLSQMKPTCCLAYRTDTGHGYCYSCPKLTREQREEKAASIRAAVKSS
ncbi:(2Fe-2S)-binding protein [Paenibacillus sp. YPG26]|uniref:(2Fe-2S)-binding protein n=1 Tax=Paenibacillus sp. YPG26 TaxID=2878915 RepID=UPI00203C6AC9|nr:(2Fe-2S)-binding protein [Paenibacillus sp. YPG26]USB32934.1 (2Fe-2S)-binding protein [Paenibacillus sp. YPG26]